MSNNYVSVANQGTQNNATVSTKIIDTSEIAILSTTSTTAITAGNFTVTPASMTGIVVNQPLVIDSIASTFQETVFVSAITGTTFTANFRYAHSSGCSIVLNVERQNFVVSDPTTYGLSASVATGPAGQSETGLTVRPIQAPLVAGSASIGNVGLNAGSNTIGAVTQSGVWTSGLSAGTNIIGKIGIDQTSPGTSNGVQINAALPAGTNTIGAVNINGTIPISGSITLGAPIPSGTNSIGTIGLNAGSNVVGKFGIDQSSPGSTNGVQITGPGTLSSNTLFTQNIGTYNSSPLTLTNGQVAPPQLDSSGNQKVNLQTALPAGSNVIGGVTQSGAWTTTLGTGSNLVGGVNLVDTAGTNKASISSVGALKVLIDPSSTSSVSLTGASFTSTNLNTNLANAIPTGTNSIGTVGLNAGTNSIGSVKIDQTSPGTSNGVQINAALPTGANTIGSINQAGLWNVGLNVGNNIIGKVTIDQTIPGTTNAIQITGTGTAIGTPLFGQSIGIYNSTVPTITNGNSSVIQLDANGNQKINLATALPTGTNIIGKIGIDQTNPGTTNGIVLNTGTNSVGTVGINTGTNSIGTVGLNAG